MLSITVTVNSLGDDAAADLTTSPYAADGTSITLRSAIQWANDDTADPQVGIGFSVAGTIAPADFS